MSVAAHVIDLPPEILQKVFTCLALEDLLSVRLTCRKFKDAASVPQVFQLDFKSWPSLVEELKTAVLLDSNLLSNITALNLSKKRLAVDVGGDTSDDEPIHLITVEQLHRLRQHCDHLRHLQISNDFDDKVTLDDLPQGLTTLILSHLMYFRAYKFFAIQGKTVMRNLMNLSIIKCGSVRSDVCDAIAGFTALRKLSLTDMPDFRDSDFTRLDGHLPNLEVLEVVDTRIGDKSFEIIGRSFENLKKLVVSKCLLVTDPGFSALKANHRLEELDVNALRITDTSVRRVIGSLVNLRILRLCNCPIGNDTMLSICQCLPNLQKLRLVPEERGIITDDGISNVMMHERLLDLQLINVVVTNDGIKRLAPCVPNLQLLHICSCNIGDEGLMAIAEHMPNLTQLTLKATLITDLGFNQIQERLCKLERLEVESVHLTETVIRNMLDFLAPMTTVVLTSSPFGDGIYVHEKPPSRRLEFKGQMLSTALVIELLRVFSGASLLTLSAIELCLADVDSIAEFCPNLISLDLYCFDKFEVFCAILKSCSLLEELYLFDCSLPKATVLEITKYSHKLQELFINYTASAAFLSAETLLEIAPFLGTLKFCEFHTSHLDYRLVIDRRFEGKCKLYLSSPSVTDAVLEALLASLCVVHSVSISDTRITGDGLKNIAPYVYSLTHLELELTTADDTWQTTDQMLDVIGSTFPSKLRCIVIKGGLVTDAGLLLLGKQLASVKKLEVSNVLVTDAGIKELAAKLTSCKTLVCNGNRNLSPDIFPFMDEHFPNMLFLMH